MTTICITPYKQSLAQINKFQLVFPRISNTVFFCTEVKVPGATIGENDQPTPFIDLKVPGDKISYDTLDITFLVDSEYKAWKDIFNWMTGLGFPERFEQYAQLKDGAMRRGASVAGVRPPYSDAILTIHTNKENAARNFKFRDVFPLSISGLDLSYAGNGAAVVMKCQATFRFSYFTLEDL